MKNCFVALFLFWGLFSQASLYSQTIDLKGEWKFCEDPDDVGLKNKWFNTSLPGIIKLPGCMTENGKGNKLTLKTQWTGSIYDSSWFYNPRMEKYRKPGNLKFPFWLTPDLYYVGPAWYQKEIEIPALNINEQIVLNLERPHWESMVWIDSISMGMQNSLSVPHRYQLEGLTKGKHILTVRIDNRTKEINPGPDSHSITDHTQGNWNGIVGEIELQKKQRASFTFIQTFPNIEAKKVVVKLGIRNNGLLKKGQVVISASLFNSSKKQTIPDKNFNLANIKGDTLELEYSMGNTFELWDEFNPALYRFNIKLLDKNEVLDSKFCTVGMREITIKNTRFYVNGVETFLRGTVENAVFPKTGYMPVDEDSWIRVFSICKKWGLNHMRFHSVCPPEAAFEAADKIGIYLQPEGPSWANHGSSLGDGRPIDKYIWEETERIVNEYGNHPSFTFFAYGNEPKGRYVAYLTKWVQYWKNKDKRRLYTGASTGGSWQIIPQSEYLVRARPRGLVWRDLPENSFDYTSGLEKQTIPYISHEMGQWCVFPNFNEIPKYTGYLKAKNFELFKEDLEDKNLGDQWHDFLMASGKLQTLCYKSEIEGALRTPGLAGFQLLSLNDYSGQGTALVGLLDAFWDEKGYVTAKEFNQFCSPIVPLVRLPKFVFKNGEEIQAKCEVANFSGMIIKSPTINWKISDSSGLVVDSGKFDIKEIEIGNCISLGEIKTTLSTASYPQEFKLELAVNSNKNSWNVWVYPKPVKTDSTAIYTCSKLDDKALNVLTAGGKVLILAAGKVDNGKDVIQYFTPVFWNTSWFKMRPPHTTGVLIQKNHPLFKHFPTEYYSNFQWYELLNKQQVMNLDSFPVNFKPIVQPIDTWFINRKLGLIFEANVRNGKVLVCSADLTTNPENRIVANSLLSSVYNYMNSTEFIPVYSLNENVLRDIFEVKERKKYDSFTKDSPDELKPNYNKNQKKKLNVINE